MTLIKIRDTHHKLRYGLRRYFLYNEEVVNINAKRGAGCRIVSEVDPCNNVSAVKLSGINNISNNYSVVFIVHHAVIL